VTTESNSLDGGAKAEESFFSDEWAWYASRDGGERYDIGPCDSRQSAIDEAIENEYGIHDDLKACSFTIIEAKQKPIRIASLLDMVAITENWEERCAHDLIDPESGESLFDGVKKPQWDELEAELEKVADAWQVRHKIVITPWAFTSSRNKEEVTVALLPDTLVDIKPATEAERIGSDSLTTDDDRVEQIPVDNAGKEGDSAFDIEEKREQFSDGLGNRLERPWSMASAFRDGWEGRKQVAPHHPTYMQEWNSGADRRRQHDADDISRAIAEASRTPDQEPVETVARTEQQYGDDKMFAHGIVQEHASKQQPERKFGSIFGFGGKKVEA
jgi:hypothetical protein